MWVFTSDGGEVRRSVYAATRELAHEEMTRLKADSLGGVRLPSTGQTVGEYVEYWLAEVAQHRVRPSTMASYRWLAKSYVLPYLGSKKLARVRPTDVRAFLNRLKGVCQCYALGKDARRRDRGQRARCSALVPRQCCGSFLAVGSGRYVHRLLRAALQDAFGDGLVADNAAKNLRVSHRYRPKFTPWSAEQARQFLVTVREDRLYALYAVALGLGLRRGELLALRWVDVDLVDGVIRVEHTLQRISGSLRLGPVKTDGSARLVGVPASVLAVLEAHPAVQSAERAEPAERWHGLGMVFTTKLGTPIEPRNMTGIWTCCVGGPGCPGSVS